MREFVAERKILLIIIATPSSIVWCDIFSLRKRKKWTNYRRYREFQFPIWGVETQDSTLSWKWKLQRIEFTRCTDSPLSLRFLFMLYLYLLTIIHNCYIWRCSLNGIHNSKDISKLKNNVSYNFGHTACSSNVARIILSSIELVKLGELLTARC